MDCCLKTVKPRLGFQFLADAYLKGFRLPHLSEITAMGEGFSQAFRNQKIVFQTAGMWDIQPTWRKRYPLNGTS